MVPEQQPIKSVKELVDYAKANPGKPYGTFGNATTSHLYGELLKKVANIDMTHVPYRGSAPLTNDLLANTVTSAFADLTTASAQIKAGKLRALAVGGEKRRKAMPDVPTMGELGYPGFEIEGWLGVFVPAATPKEIVTKLSDELARIIASPEGVAGIEALSLVPVGGSAEAFEKVLRRDYDEMGRCREGNRRQGRVSDVVIPGAKRSVNYPESGFRVRADRAPRNDGERSRHFKCFAKNARLRGQAMSALALS